MRWCSLRHIHLHVRDINRLAADRFMRVSVCLAAGSSRLAGVGPCLFTCPVVLSVPGMSRFDA